MIEKMKDAVLLAAKIREESYDKVAYAAAYEEARAKMRKDFGVKGLGLEMQPWVDPKDFYRKSLEQACEEAWPEGSFPLYLLLRTSWNDVLDWAEERS